jgi:hypothetical protein
MTTIMKGFNADLHSPKLRSMNRESLSQASSFRQHVAWVCDTAQKAIDWSKVQDAMRDVIIKLGH